ncbi:hypothetical protein [Microbacterium sp. A84]|uniref:hypothetical protein n=1 Tax=Microbacterium sp. A84 TaxID=3450715 RepID=UPI003F43DE7F
MFAGPRDLMRADPLPGIENTMAFVDIAFHLTTAGWTVTDTRDNPVSWIDTDDRSVELVASRGTVATLRIEMPNDDLALMVGIVPDYDPAAGSTLEVFVRDTKIDASVDALCTALTRFVADEAVDGDRVSNENLDRIVEQLLPDGWKASLLDDDRAGDGSGRMLTLYPPRGSFVEIIFLDQFPTERRLRAELRYVLP